ncbi:MAG: hypothetical protein ABI954_10500 [Pyrinomonadaceae bacterium]
MERGNPRGGTKQKNVSVFITILETEENAEQNLRPLGLAVREFVVPEDLNNHYQRKF